MHRTFLKWTLNVLLVTVFLLFSQHAVGGGFYLSEVASPGSLGTAGATNVTNNWATDAAWTNPAGMTGLKRDQVLGGMQALLPFNRFDSSISEAGGSDGGNAGVAAVVPGAYAVKTLGEQFRFGFAMTAPLGGGLDYTDNFVGRYQATKAQIAGVAFSPSLAYRVSERLSVGVGVSAIYTVFNMDIAINQPGALADGKVKFEDLDDWSYQGFFGLTFQVTDNLMFGAVYRTKSKVELEGDIKFRNIQVPILNRVTSRLNKMEIDFDYPQVIDVGVKYSVTDKLTVYADFDWEDWSEFSENHITIEGGETAAIKTLDRNWKNTYHLGAGLTYSLGDIHHVAMGVSYDSSVVDNRDRTADLPLDKQVKFSVGYGTSGEGNLRYGVAATCMYMGDGKMDQTAQGARFKGEFDTNFLLMVGGMLQWRF